MDFVPTVMASFRSAAQPASLVAALLPTRVVPHPQFARSFSVADLYV
jgi:hypothetical protein